MVSFLQSIVVLYSVEIALWSSLVTHTDALLSVTKPSRWSISQPSSFTLSATSSDTSTTTATTTKTGESYDAADGFALHDAKAWEKGYTTCQKEVCEIISNEAPKDLKGTFYRNGFAKFESGKDKIKHPFDGDGMIHAATFNDGQVLYRNRFVRTKIFERERKSNSILQRGAFGTQKPGGIFGNFFSVDLRDVSNTNVIYYGKRLISLYESTTPYVLEADSLRTLKKTTMNGLLKPKQPFSAHPKVDGNTGRLINFSAAMNGKSTDMTLYEFNEAFKCIKTREFQIPGFTFFHDFAVTKNYYLFVKPPMQINPLKFALGLTGIAECISYDMDQPNTIYIVPRDASQPIETVEVDNHFNFHFSNAYETDEGNIVLDSVRCNRLVLGDTSASDQPVWESLEFATTVPFTTLERYTLTPVAGGAWTAGKSQQLSQRMVEFPSINPKVMGRKYRYVYASLGTDPGQPSPQRAVLKVDLDQQTESTWLPQPYEFLGELVFAQKSTDNSATTTTATSAAAATTEAEEDDGYLLTYCWNGKDMKSELLVFDARDVTKGPVSRIALPTMVGHGLHGHYAPNLVFPPDDVIRKFKAFSALDGKWNEMKGGFSGLGISYDM